MSLLPQFLKKAIDGEITRATEQEFEEAKNRLEKRKSEIIAGVVLYVTKMVQFETMSDKVIITVREEK